MADTRDLSDLIKTLERVAKEAYERGYADGRREGIETAMRRILKAASEDLPEGKAQQVIPAQPIRADDVGTERREPPSRVERGAVRRVLKQVMSAVEGQSMAAIAELAKAVDHRISPTSVPNELRRNAGTLYRQDGTLWFLIGNAEKETAGFAANERPAALVDDHGRTAMDPP